MKKELLCLALCFGLTFCTIVGCSSKMSTSNDVDAKKKVETALENLKNLDKTYEISNVMQAPDGKLCYVEICDNGTSYTEYPQDADGNYGTVAFQNADSNVDYILTDWVTQEGKGYMLTGTDSWVSYPDSYSKNLKSRNVMYFDKMLEGMSGLKFKETVTDDIGMGDEEIDIYTATLDKDTTRSILGLGSEEIYSAIKSETDDDNIKDLCQYYLDDISFTMVFSDAKLKIGVSDDILRYVQIEVGGLGTRMYYTKAVLTQSVDVREEPDFSNTSTYESTMKEMADCVAEYGSYEEAMSALSEQTGSSDTEATSNDKTDEADEGSKDTKATPKPESEDKEEKSDSSKKSE